MRLYAITGATGNTGHVIARRLLDQGHKVRAIGRDAKRLAPLAAKGAEARVGPLEDEKFLTEAFRGTDAVYAMIPPNLKAANARLYQSQVGQAVANAIRNAGVKHVVHLSSLGAHLPEKTGPIAGLHEQETRLNQLSGANILHLRPAYFMENLLGNVQTIKSMGICGGTMRGDLKIPMIATRDIAEYAAERLARLDFSGHMTRELLGQRDLSLNEVSRILGQSVGKPDMPYVQFPYEDAEKTMTRMGISQDVAHSFIEMSKAFNSGLIEGLESRSPENTTPTSIEDFTKVFAEAYAG